MSSAETVSRSYENTLPLMGFNDVILVAVQVRMCPYLDAEEMLDELRLCCGENMRREVDVRSAILSINCQYLDP